MALGLALQLLLYSHWKPLVQHESRAGNVGLQDEDEVVGLGAEGDVGVTRRQVGVMLREQVQHKGVHQARQPRQHRRHECHDRDALQSSARHIPKAAKHEVLKKYRAQQSVCLASAGPYISQRLSNVKSFWTSIHSDQYAFPVPGP